MGLVVDDGLGICYFQKSSQWQYIRSRWLKEIQTFLMGTLYYSCRSQKFSCPENRKNYWWWLFRNCPLKWPIWRCQQKKIVNVQPEQANQLHPTQPQDFILCYNSSSEVFVPIITLWVDWYQPSQLTNFGTLASLQQVCKLTKPKSGPNIKDPTQN